METRTEFDCDVLEYTHHVTNDIEKIDINAVTSK